MDAPCTPFSQQDLSREHGNPLDEPGTLTPVCITFYPEGRVSAPKNGPCSQGGVLQVSGGHQGGVLVLNIPNWLKRMMQEPPHFLQYNLLKNCFVKRFF